MSKKSAILCGLLVAAFFGLALYFRAALPYDQVFTSQGIKFTGVDAYWHMRSVELLVHNFPSLPTFDPFAIYPGGGATTVTAPFFDYVIASVAWIVGLGSPSSHLIDSVGAWFPAVLGALSVVPAYFIGKTLAGRWAGVFAAAFLAIMPGEFLGRSILGFADHHVAEVFLSTTFVCFLLLAVKSGSAKWGVAAGITLGCFLLTWSGAWLFAAIWGVFVVVQVIISHLRGESSRNLCLASCAVFGSALLMILVFSRNADAVMLLALCVCGSITLDLGLRLSERYKLPRYAYPAAIAGLAGIGIGLVLVLGLGAVVGRIGAFWWDTGTTNMEMQPLLFPSGKFGFEIIFGNFTTLAIFGPIALCLVAYQAFRGKGDARMLLLFTWTLVVFGCALGQRRFNYYLAVNMAVLGGLLAWWMVEYVASWAKPSKGYVKKRKKQKGELAVSAKGLYTFVAVVVVFFVMFFPNIAKARDTASQTRFAPTHAWVECLTWLRDNSPQPLEGYLEPHSLPFEYPDTAYGVVTWWDYGYWVTRIAHRCPANNPGKGSEGGNNLVARLFVAQTDAEIQETMLKLGARYVITDSQIVSGKFHAPIALSGHTSDEFIGVFYYKDGTNLRPVTMYLPAFFQSFVVRLQLFNGQSIPAQPMGISWQFGRSTTGLYKEITNAQSFTTQAEAEAWVASGGEEHRLLCSPEPLNPPIALEPLPMFDEVHNAGDVNGIPEIRVWEYVA